jgi:hypothetical protein
MSQPAEQVQARTMSQPKTWPLVNMLDTRNSTVPITQGARLVNAYAEFDESINEYYVYQRFGLGALAFGAPAHPVGYGCYTDAATGDLFFVVSDGSTVADLYVVNPGSNVPSLIMAVDPTGPYFFGTIASGVIAKQAIVLGNGKAAYAVTSGINIGEQITNANFPSIFVRGWAFLDGTTYVMDPLGNIYGSNIGDPTTWTALNVIQASSNSDLGIALFKQLSYIIAFKQYTTQIFFDNANAPPGSPLSPVPDAQIPLGCAAAWSVQTIDNTIIWLTSNDAASPQIVQMDNLTPNIVSTSSVERILQAAMWVGGQALYSYNSESHQLTATFTPPSGISSWVIKHAGHRLYGLNLDSLNLTLVYDIDEELWYIWQGATGGIFPVTSLAYQPQNTTTLGVHYAQLNTGGIYPLDIAANIPNDIGVLFPVDIYTPNMDFGTRRGKALSAMYFNADKVPAILTARYSDDDYNSWSNPREIDLNTNKPRLTDCGTFGQRRAYHFRKYANTSLRMRSIGLQMDICTL